MDTTKSSQTATAAMAPMLLRNLVTTLFVFADNSLLSLSEHHKPLQFLRHLLASFFLFFLRFLPYFVHPLQESLSHDDISLHPPPSKKDSFAPSSASRGGSGIARALSQLLSIVNDLPVSSRKYEVVRSLAETLIEENHKEDVDVLHEVNRTVLSAAFERTVSQLEAAMREKSRPRDPVESGPGKNRLDRVLKTVRVVGEGVRELVGRGKVRFVLSGEKLAAEVVWLGQKLVDCGFGEEAFWRWASASNVARLALSAEPRLQGSLVKFSAFMLKQAKDMGSEEISEAKKEQQRQIKKKMLMSWLPLLCSGSIGTDMPVLSTKEKTELEVVLTEMIEMQLDQEEEQEQVLSLWLHHFTHCPSSDWPNLHACYTRWCASSRKLLMLQ